jgi:CheY-like chemotaxis protein
MSDPTAGAGAEQTELTDEVTPHKGVRPSVLIVDDDPDFLELASHALAETGLEVMLARTAGEALMRAVRTPPDLILLDIMLPGQDGLDVLEALRAEPETRGIPVVACTALGQRDSGALLPRLGFDGMVTKPLDLRELGRALKEHLRARSDE